MRIRTQLIAAAFLLAVLPLAAIVAWSYYSSRTALESAYKREAERVTRQMDRRLSAIRADLDRRLSVVSALPLPTSGAGAEVGDIVSVMGDAASMVDALEFHPVPAPAAAPAVRTVPAARPVEAAPAPVEVAAAPEAAEPAGESGKTHRILIKPVPATPPTPGVPSVARTGDVVVSAPVVIEIPPVPPSTRFELSEEQRELFAELARLGRQLSDQNLSPEQREDLVAELEASKHELRRMFAEHREQRDAQMREAMRQAQEAAAVLHQVFPRETAGSAAPGEEQYAPAVAASLAPPAASPNPTVAKKPAPAAPKATRTASSESRPRPKKNGHATEKSSLILGRHFATPVRDQGEIVGQLTARIRPEEVIQRVLGGGASEDGEEIPFALDREGTIYARNATDRERLGRLGIAPRLAAGQPTGNVNGWIVSSTTDPQSGLRIGVARRVGDSFEDLRRAAARNFGLGLGLIFFALIGIVPLSNHLSRDVKLVTEGAERIAQGDLMTRLPVKSKNEFGQLARAFNRMAADLSANQQQLLEQERVRREQEMQQKLLSLEYERKSVELEEARRFQLSMLPKDVPALDSCEIAAYTRTATEVGGDYYDFRHDGDLLSITIGDATGHGAKAGTMVTVIKTLFAGYEGRTSPAAFLADSAEKIKRMELGRMAMALSLARLERRNLLVASAGMPPVLVHRAATGAVEELALSATPLGTIGSEYPEIAVDLDERDTVLFMSDGFPELQNADGQQLGYVTAAEAFAEAAKSETAQEVIASLVARAEQWHGHAAPNDDVTFVVLRIV